MKTAEELDLVETDALTDALARRFDTFTFVGSVARVGRKSKREMAWGGDLRRAVRMMTFATEYLAGRRDERAGD